MSYHLLAEYSAEDTLDSKPSPKTFDESAQDFLKSAKGYSVGIAVWYNPKTNLMEFEAKGLKRIAASKFMLLIETLVTVIHQARNKD